MRVRFLTSIAGRHWYYQTGEVKEIPEDQAKQWIRNGVCVQHFESREEAIETATRATPETTLTRRGPGRPKKHF